MIASSSRTAGEKRVKTFCWHSGMSKRVERMIKEGQPFMMSQTPEQTRQQHDRYDEDRERK